MNRDIVGRCIVTEEIRMLDCHCSRVGFHPWTFMVGSLMDRVSVEQVFLKENTVRSPLFSIHQCSYTLMCHLGTEQWAR